MNVLVMMILIMIDNGLIGFGTRDDGRKWDHVRDSERGVVIPRARTRGRHPATGEMANGRAFFCDDLTYRT